MSLSILRRLFQLTRQLLSMTIYMARQQEQRRRGREVKSDAATMELTGSRSGKIRDPEQVFQMRKSDRKNGNGTEASRKGENAIGIYMYSCSISAARKRTVAMSYLWLSKNSAFLIKIWINQGLMCLKTTTALQGMKGKILQTNSSTVDVLTAT